MPVTTNLMNATQTSIVMQFYTKSTFSIIWIHEIKNNKAEQNMFQCIWYLA